MLAPEDIRDPYRRRTGWYDISANAYYVIGFREWAYRHRAVRALRAQPGATIVELGCGQVSTSYYNLWRPLTAIRAADADDNPATDPDPARTPLVATPCHPEYPAAHGAGTGGLAHAVEQFFGTKRVQFTLTSTSVTGFVSYAHHFTNTQDPVREVIDARIFGGMHYRTSGVHGTVIGNKVAHYVAKHDFQPVQ